MAGIMRDYQLETMNKEIELLKNEIAKELERHGPSDLRVLEISRKLDILVNKCLKSSLRAKGKTA